MRLIPAAVRALGFVLAGAAAALATGAAEAAPDDKIVAAGKFRLAGRVMSCLGTPTLLSPSFWDYGGATRGMIIINPAKLAALPLAVRLYVYAHECGHQIFGPRETRADCYAVQRGVRQRWLDHAGMNQICAFLKDKPADYVHPPGEVRCTRMRQCFESARPQRASR